MIRLRMFLTLAVFLLLSSGLHAESLSLAEAQRRAMQDAPSILASQEATHAAESGVDESLGQFLPQARVSETYLRTDDPVSVFGSKLQQGKFAAEDFELDSLNHPDGIDHWITRFELQQPIFKSGSDWANHKKSRELVDTQRHLEDFQRQSAKLAATRLYYTAVGLERQKETLQNGMSRLKKLEDSYELMEAPTSATTTSYLVARSVRTHMEAEEIAITAQRESVLRDLNAVLGESIETRFELQDPLPQIASLKVRKSEINAERSDIRASAAGLRAAKADRNAAVRSWGPTVDLIGAYNLYTGNFEDLQDSYDVSVRLNWNLFDWSRQGRIGRSKANLGRAKYLHQAAELKATADRETAIANVKSQVATYQTNERAFKTATEALDIAARRYEEGTLPLMDYSEAIRNWVDMKLLLVSSQLDAALAHAVYLFEVGESS